MLQVRQISHFNIDQFWHQQPYRANDSIAPFLSHLPGGFGLTPEEFVDICVAAGWYLKL